MVRSALEARSRSAVRPIGIGARPSYNTAQMDALPKWVISNRESVEREAAPYRGMTPSERARVLRAACRAASRQLAGRTDRERLLAYRDPLPESSVQGLKRLRARYRQR